MSPLQLVHYWVSFGALLLGAAAAVNVFVGLAFPSRSKTGARLVRGGVAAMLSVVAIYLVYAATAVAYVVVMRS